MPPRLVYWLKMSSSITGRIDKKKYLCITCKCVADQESHVSVWQALYRQRKCTEATYLASHRYSHLSFFSTRTTKIVICLERFVCTLYDYMLPKRRFGRLRSNQKPSFKSEGGLRSNNINLKLVTPHVRN